MVRSVVTGGAGFLGSHLCDRLLQEGHDVVCIDNFSTGAAANVAHLAGNPRFRLLPMDVTYPIGIKGSVDFVAHLASPASPSDYLRMPIQTMVVGSVGTLNALTLARQSDARFLLASTSEVYGDPQVHPQPEDYFGNANPVGPRGVYVEAKRFAEALTMAHRRSQQADTAIVRIFNTFGPRMRPSDGRAVPTFIGQALRGDPITVTGDGQQTRSLCYIDDLVEAIHRMLVTDLAGPVNIGNPHETTMIDLARWIRELTGSRSPITFIAAPQDDPRVRKPDLTLARSQLHWSPTVAVIQGLQRTITWFREHPDCVPTLPDDRSQSQRLMDPAIQAG